MLRLRDIWHRSLPPSLAPGSRHGADGWAEDGGCAMRALRAGEIARGTGPHHITAEAVREVALGAALAMSLDTSPAALLSMYEYARPNGALRRRLA